MAQGDLFLKIEGIDGESKDDKHKNEIDIDGFGFGESQGGTFGSGGGGGGGKVLMQDFHFSKSVDKSSPKLFLACATGEHIKSATLTVRKAGKEQQEFYVVKFSDILVSSFSTSGSAHGGNIPSESISFNFSKIEWEYKPQNADGTLAGGIKAGYDVKANKKV